MKLSRVLNKRVGDKTYYKWMITVPPNVVAELDWSTATVLDYNFDRDLSVLRLEGKR